MILHPTGLEPNVQDMVDELLCEKEQSCYGIIEVKPNMTQTTKEKPIECPGMLRTSSKINALPPYFIFNMIDQNISTNYLQIVTCLSPSLDSVARTARKIQCQFT
jgi:hypothetical protein